MKIKDMIVGDCFIWRGTSDKRLADYVIYSGVRTVRTNKRLTLNGISPGGERQSYLVSTSMNPAEDVDPETEVFSGEGVVFTTGYHFDHLNIPVYAYGPSLPTVYPKTQKITMVIGRMMYDIDIKHSRGDAYAMTIATLAVDSFRRTAAGKKSGWSWGSAIDILSSSVGFVDRDKNTPIPPITAQMIDNYSYYHNKWGTYCRSMTDMLYSLVREAILTVRQREAKSALDTAPYLLARKEYDVYGPIQDARYKIINEQRQGLGQAPNAVIEALPETVRRPAIRTETRTQDWGVGTTAAGWAPTAFRRNDELNEAVPVEDAQLAGVDPENEDTFEDEEEFDEEEFDEDADDELE